MIRESSLYFTANLLGRAAPFVVVPLLTSRFSPAEFGTLSLFLLAIAFSNAVFGLSLHTAVPRFFFTARNAQPAAFLRSLVHCLGASVLVAMLLAIALGPAWGGLLGVPALALLLVPLSTFCMTATQIYGALLRCRVEASRFLKLEAVQAALAIGLTAWLVLALDVGWVGRVIGFLLPAAGIALLLLRECGGPAPLLHVDAVAVRALLRASMPMLPFAFFNAVTYYIDRWFIEHHLGLAAVGIYALACQMGVVILLFSDAFLKSWAPLAYARMNRADTGAGPARWSAGRALLVFVAVLAGLVLLLPRLFELVFPWLFAPAYAPALDHVAGLTLANALLGLAQLFFPLLLQHRRHAAMVGVAAAAALLNVALNAVLVPRLGIDGAVFATLGSYAACLLLTAGAARPLWRSVGDA